MDHYQEIFEKIPDGVTLHDAADGSIIDTNQQFCEMLGYTREELLSLDFDALHVGEPPYTSEQATEHIRKAATEGPQTFEWVDQTKGGDPLPVEVHLRQTTIEGEERILAVVRDITERKARTQKLQAQAAAMDAAIDGMAILDDTGEYTFVNQAHADIYGYDDPTAFLGESWQLCYSDAELARFESEVLPTLREDGAWRGEATGQRRDGTTFPQELSLTTLEDGGMVCVVRDITDRKESERARRQHERALATLHEVASDLAEYHTVDAVCQRIITAAEEVLAFDRSVIAIEDDGTLVVRAAGGGLAPEEYGPIPVDEGIAGKSYRTGRTFHIDDVTDWELATPQGPVRSVISVAMGDHGNFQASAKTTAAFDDRDVELAELLVAHATTALDRIAHERTLKRRTDRMKSVAGLVSHDLRNPLTVARGNLDLVQEECESERLARIGEALDRMEELIGETLTLAKEGRTTTDRQRVDLADLVTACWQNVATEGGDIIVDEEMVVWGDPVGLRSLFENLFRNAIDHGEESVTVRVGALEEGEGFYVADDGPGIPVGEREAVFDAGYSTSGEGTGLGLSIVQEIVAGHGWTIAVTDSRSGGARFEVRDVELVDG